MSRSTSYALVTIFLLTYHRASSARRQKNILHSDTLQRSRGRGVENRRSVALDDPFADVPTEWVQNAARNGIDFLKLAATSSQSQSTAFLEKARNLSASTKWDEESLKQALSSVECQGSEHKRSCAFKNLYFNQDEGGFFVFSLEGTELPDFSSVLLLHKWSHTGSIKRKNFASLTEVGAFFDEHKIIEHEGLSLIFESIWHHNIGHAIWDGLYPAFQALVEWGRHAEKYRSVVGIALDCKQPGTEDGKCMSEGVFKHFGGGEFLPFPGLKGTGWHRFVDSIAGSGGKGQRSINKDYALPGGRNLDAVRLFRDRIYSSYGIEVPLARESGDGRPLPLQGIIISNKRFSPSEVDLLKTIATKTSEKGTLQLKYIDFAGNESLRGNFKNQLEMFGKLSVHISGPGTAQAYEPFLPDGSVHLNLGDRRNIPGASAPTTDRSLSFLEEVWSEGVPYLRALHYDPLRKKPIELEKGELEASIGRAVALAQEGFEMPVAPGENLSPIGHVFIEYCAALGHDCDDLLSLMNGYKSTGFSGVTDHWWCNANAWAETIVFEVGGWSEAGVTEDDKTITHCLMNRGLLREIRRSHFGW